MSSYGVMRGLHFQRPPFTQSKLVRCVKGRVIIIPSFFVDKASCTRQFESELSLHSLASLFPIKKGIFSNPSVSLSKGSSTSNQAFSIVFTTPSVPLVGDRNLRRKDVNRPTRCSEPLRSKVGGPKRSSPYCAGWDRLAVMGISLQLYC